MACKENTLISGVCCIPAPLSCLYLHACVYNKAWISPVCANRVSSLLTRGGSVLFEGQAAGQSVWKQITRENFVTHTLPALWSSIKEGWKQKHTSEMFSLQINFCTLGMPKKISSTILTDLEIVGGKWSIRRFYLIEVATCNGEKLLFLPVDLLLLSAHERGFHWSCLGPNTELTPVLIVAPAEYTKP